MAVAGVDLGVDLVGLSLGVGVERSLGEGVEVVVARSAPEGDALAAGVGAPPFMLGAE